MVGIPAGVPAVGRIGKQGPESPVSRHRPGRRVAALHLVQYDARPHQATVLIPFETVTLLFEGFFFELGKEHRIPVDPQQVQKVSLHGTGGRIDGLVRIGHGVQERMGASLQQHQERIFKGITLGTAQNGMFQDMGHAGVVGRRRPECEGEEVLRILRPDPVDLGAGSAMPEVETLGSVFLQGIHRNGIKTPGCVVFFHTPSLVPVSRGPFQPR